MNKYLHRPMFRKGGSAGEGITSGLQRRTGFSTGSTRDRLMKAVGPSRRSNLNDFLINFGLNMVGSPPTGNVLQTAAIAAKDPYAEFSKASRADDDLMRKIALEAETLDIGQEQALELQALKNVGGSADIADMKLARQMLAQNLINEETGKVYTLSEALEYAMLSKSDVRRASLSDRIANTRDKYLMAGDEYPVADAKARYYEDIYIRLNEKVPADMIGNILPTTDTLREKLLKKESSIGKYFYDMTDGKVKKFMGIKEVEGTKGYDWVDVDQETFEEIITTGDEVIDKEKIIGTTTGETKLSRAEAEVEAEARGLVLIPIFTENVRGQGQKFRRENPNAVSIPELIDIIEKEKAAERYKHLKNKTLKSGR